MRLFHEHELDSLKLNLKLSIYIVSYMCKYRYYTEFKLELVCK